MHKRHLKYRDPYAAHRQTQIGRFYKHKTRLKARKRSLYGGMNIPTPLRGFVRTGGYYGQPLELKFHDVDLDDAVVANSATITDSICKIPQGTTEKTRIGRKCTIKQIGWRFNIMIPEQTSSALTGETVRVLLYIDKQCNGATAAATDILESDDFQSFNNLANKNRFRTLMDRTYDLNCKAGSGRGATDTLAFGETLINDTFFKKVNIPIEFDSTTGAITEIKSNNIGVLLIAQEGIASFQSKIRLRFSDG